jgi:hypothetical protein
MAFGLGAGRILAVCKCKKWSARSGYVLGKRVSSMTCPSTKSQTSHFMFFRAQNQYIV